MSTVTVDGKNVMRHDGEPLQESDPHVLVHAQRTSCINGIKEDVVVVFERIEGRELPILSLCNGITGYESWYIDKAFLHQIRENGLIACSGTPMMYDELYITATEARIMADELLFP